MLSDTGEVDAEVLAESVSDMLDNNFSKAVSGILETCGERLAAGGTDLCPPPQVVATDESGSDSDGGSSSSSFSSLGAGEPGQGARKEQRGQEGGAATTTSSGLDHSTVYRAPDTIQVRGFGNCWSSLVNLWLNSGYILLKKKKLKNLFVCFH